MKIKKQSILVNHCSFNGHVLESKLLVSPYFFSEICAIKSGSNSTYWTTNLEAKCSDITEYHYFYNKCILDSAFCSLCAGMIIGAIASKG